ncbi:hypothetical protein M407DRAFT_102117 [Tulasnella calospora MUT 4182]|uniref:Uncharacterized protein n=1 Tax=Tulasnella calospora MUT 4182 TaxID=1051891 RepID=A0A0C3Q5C1_9AGAM|nr:hypothetical protein M407DRAFT_102117 [Tulasnella calospora MUT 4182]
MHLSYMCTFTCMMAWKINSNCRKRERNSEGGWSSSQKDRDIVQGPASLNSYDSRTLG